MALGIRSDETRRVRRDDARNLIYPLVDVWPTDKQAVLDWWEEQPFDLEIDEFEGNRRGCFKKSLRKHFMQIERDPSAYDFHRRMEALYRRVGPQAGERVFFRGNMSTEGLFRAYEENDGNFRRGAGFYEDAGCSESCEVFDTVAGR